MATATDVPAARDEQFIGITSTEAYAIEPPAEWKSDILSYHAVPNNVSIIDPYASGGPLVAEHVAVIKTSNPIARLWLIDRCQETLSYEFMTALSADKGEPELVAEKFQFITNDSALNAVMDQTTRDALVKEFCERAAELLATHMASAHKVCPPVIGQNRAPMAFYLWAVQSCAIYGLEAGGHGQDPQPPFFEALRKLANLPTLDERVRAYSANHEGGGVAVAVPISYWNRSLLRHRLM